MKPFIACAFVALLSGAMASPASPGAVAKWAAFKAKHGKQHAPHEESVRMARFLERDAEIEAHNARFAAGQESYSRQHSQFSDLSLEEFRKNALGFTPAVNASDIPFAEAISMPNAPAELDWRKQGIMTSVKDQGSCGSCYAFAGAGALEAYLRWKTGNTYDSSEQDVVDCSYKKFMNGNHNSGCQGGWPTAVYDYYISKGVIMESQYPYTSGRTRTHGACRIPTPVNDGVRGKLRTQNVRVRSENDICDILASKGPLVVAIAADNNWKPFFDDLAEGVFDNASAIGAQPNHAVVLAGYGVYGGKPYWLIKNSWGDRWASGGYGKIARGKNMCGIMSFGVWYVEP